MWRCSVAACIFILFTYFQNINGWRSFTINASNISSTVYSDKYRLNVSVVNNALNIRYQMNEAASHFMASVEIYLQSPDDGQYNVELMNRTINLCTLFSNKLYEPLVQILFEIIKQHGDIPDGCPLKPRTYNFENVILDAENFPPYLPERRGYSQMKFFKKTKNSLILRSAILCFFEIKSKAAKRFKTNNGN